MCLFAIYKYFHYEFFLILKITWEDGRYLMKGVLNSER